MATSQNTSISTTSYKFKYIYLILGIVFVITIMLTYWLPNWFPSVFTESMWVLQTDPATGIQSIETISDSTATVIINILRDVVISGLVGIILYAFYEHRFENEEKQALINSVNQILSDNIELHIIKAILTSKEVTKHVLSPGMIDEILHNCLAEKVGSESKADAIMESLLENVINKSGTIRNLDVSMTMSNFSDPKHRYCAYEAYKMIYVIRYKVILATNSFVFIITNKKSIQNENLGPFTYCQFIDSSFSGSEVYFKVNEVTIDGEPLVIQDSRLTTANCVKEIYWNTSCNAKQGEELEICYSVEFLVRKHGNHYSYFSPFMTDGLHLKFVATNTDIKRIKLLTYFNSGKKPTILPPPETEDNPKTIEISLNDWVLPSSGASFVWQFEKK